jgi:hypothetical protein
LTAFQRTSASSLGEWLLGATRVAMVMMLYGFFLGKLDVFGSMLAPKYVFIICYTMSNVYQECKM